MRLGRAGRWGAALAVAVCLAGRAQAATVTVTRGTLTVTCGDPRDRAQLPLVFHTWAQATADLRAHGLNVRAVHLIAASSAADFARMTGEPASIAASTRGQTITTQRLGALAARGILDSTVRHEAFHTTQPSGLPRWLAEGLARVFSGEARTDPPAPAALTALNGTQLDAQLLGRDAGQARDAYREATRRALALVKRAGWAGALGTR